MDPIDIKAAVHKQRLTLTQISLAAGLSGAACRYALRRPARRAEAAIVAALGRPPQELWPDRYDAAGERRPRRRTPRSSTSAKSAQTRRETQPR